MTLSRFIHRHLLLPAFETGLKRRRAFRYWNELEQSQWLDRGSLEHHQLLALQRLIRHAQATCPYYGNAWSQAGLNPAHLRTLADFARWPITDRETIREHRASMRTTLRSMPLISKATGGSTGAPLQFDLDHGSNDRRTAAWHRGYGWAGAPPGTKQLYLWGVPPVAGTPAKQLKDKLYHALYRRHIVSCFEMEGDFAAQFAATLDHDQPDAIVAYANPLYEVASRLEVSGITPSFQPASIITGAEKLHGFQRERIERVFGAPVFESYGSREFMLIGAECERHNGLHLTSEHLLVEVLNDDGSLTPSGHEGNIVITDLFNYGLPFIRYANGDRAIAGFESCPCGRGLPLLKQVVGRRLDMLQGTNGKVIPGEFFPHLVKDFPAVRRFQVTQDQPDRVRFALVADEMSATDRARLEGLIRTEMGSGVRVDFDAVANIPLTASGKLQVVLNRIPPRRAA